MMRYINITFLLTYLLFYSVCD